MEIAKFVWLTDEQIEQIDAIVAKIKPFGKTDYGAYQLFKKARAELRRDDTCEPALIALDTIERNTGIPFFLKSLCE